MYRPDPAAVVCVLQGILQRGSSWQAGGFDPATGCDCWGLVWWAYQHAGVVLPQDIWEAEHLFTPVAPPYQPWDLLLFNLQPFQGARHLGLLLAPPYGYQVSKATNGLGRFCLFQALWRRVLSHGLRYKGWRHGVRDTPGREDHVCK